MLETIAIMLRHASKDLAVNITPVLPEGGAIERIAFVRQLLDLAAAEMHLVDVEEADYRREADRLISSAARLLGIDADTPKSHAVGRGVRQVRARLAPLVLPLLGLIEQKSDKSEDAATLLHEIFAIDMRWRTSLEKSRVAAASAVGNQPAIYQPVTPEALAAFINNRLSPDIPIVVTEVRRLSGGVSKETYVVSLAPNAELPERMVLRRDTSGFSAYTQRGVTTVRDEVPVLTVLADRGIPVPRPVLYELYDNSLGKPFMLSDFCPGTIGGNHFNGFFESSRMAFEQLAVWFAKIHSASPAAFGFGQDALQTSEDLMTREVSFRWERWRRDAVEASPIIECAFAWLLRECRTGLGKPAIVHGDAGPHNILLDESGIRAILDWEIVHVGDPAEDLAFLRSAIEKQFSWQEFLEIYYRNGGQPVDERRLKIFTVFNLLRYCSLGASAATTFLSGASDNFIIGAIGLTPIPLFEKELIDLIGADLVFNKAM